MQNQSLWRRTELPSASGLDTEFHCEVAVVGGGITGLTTALLLAEAGKNVALFESRRLGAGVSGATTAHLTEVLDTRYHVLESKFGVEGSRLARAASRLAIDKIRTLAGDGDPAFQTVDGYLFTDRQEQLSELDAELAAADRAGAAVERVAEVPLPLDQRGGLKIRHQAQLNPLSYLSALATRLMRFSSRVYEGVQVLNVDTKAGLRLETDAGRSITADAVVLATHAPFASMKLELQLAQYRSYVVAGRVAQPLRGLFWDMADPYHYFRSAELDGQPYLIVGGGDHRTGVVPAAGPEAPFRELTGYAKRLRCEPELRWSAQVVEPSDGLPLIGQPDTNVPLYVAQGFSGNGMTFGTLSALLITDSLLGSSNPYAELFRANRFKPLASAGAVLSENAKTAVHLAGGHLTPASSEPIEELAPGEGRIVSVDGKKVAVCRDRDGRLHAVSPICTHQGCQVAFNPVEQSWDCPCHGSRFDPLGRVLDGPAKKPLESLNSRLEAGGLRGSRVGG
jgi:glycine/D-amino acid oxidase-like deaminating enzyme/nitrite reductase/ring-hydroxylating ferredoxin subunit